MEFQPSLGYKQGLYRKRSKVHAIVVHTTGVGILLKWKKSGAAHKEATPFETSIRVYTRQMTAGPHYIVCGDTGRIVQVCPHELAAHHVGAAKSGPYWHPNWSKTSQTAWWGKRWSGLSSPIELAGGNLWLNASCNRNTIGIEVVPALSAPRGPWAPDCYKNLRTLLTAIASEHKVPFTREYIFSHSDAHPLARSAKGQPWDPSPAQWTWEAFQSAALKT